MPSGIYISIPFCRFKCTYCNFASGVFPESDLDAYLDALAREWRPFAGMPADTVYLGGGTPSMLTSGQITRLFEGLRAGFDIAGSAEITLEAAPGGFTRDLAESWRSAGVNRVSLGVQSFIERELRAVGRPHRSETVAADAAVLREAGFDNIGFDLIAGLPHQTEASWDESLAWLARLRPEHASVYVLEIDGDSRLGAEALAGGARYSARDLPDDDAAADFYCRAIERLRELGYEQYEISNFALPGRRSRHNLKYWEDRPYLGFGVDAHSFDGRQRWANTDSLEEYLARAARGESPEVERHAVDERSRNEERFFLGLRRNEGIILAPGARDRFRSEIDELTATGLLEFAGGRLRLTDRGRLLSNDVLANFIE